MSLWEKNRQVVTFQIFIWSVAVVNAFDACLQFGVHQKKIRFEAGTEYERVDMKNRAFITAAEQWLRKEGIINSTPVFRRHLKIGRRLKELVVRFSEAILLLNYEDEDLEFLSKTGIYKISSDDWGLLTTALSELKEGSPPPWIDYRLPSYAHSILGLEDQSGPRTPPRPPHHPAQHQLPSPAPTPKKKKTAPIDKNTLEIFRSNTEWYSDQCFYVILDYATYDRTDVRFLDSLLLPTNKNDPRREMARGRSFARAVSPSDQVFLAPVNRNKNHWVAYAGRRDSGGAWSWHFADSMHGSPKDYEIEDIRQLLGLPAPDIDSIVKNVSIPRQKDSYSCGPFALEWLLKFMENDTTPKKEWGSNPTQIREKHLQMVTEAFKSGIVPLLKEDGGTPGDVEVTSVRPVATSPARQLFQGEGGRTGSGSREVDTRAEMLLESKEVGPGKDDGERSDGIERMVQ
ncbi:hypothetical protein HK104_004499 [Borealophlyctis nickersoniae]|nr:hypothetical protein HK104_004499 [Borealophlyctis nickersoniae]